MNWDDLKKLEALLVNGQTNGVEGLSLLSFDEALQIQPTIKLGLISGI